LYKRPLSIALLNRHDFFASFKSIHIIHIVIIKYNPFRHKLCYVLFCASLMCLSSCVPTKFLEKDEYLLYKQSVKNNKKISSESLEQFYRQKPNRKILYMPIMPYLYAYFKGEQQYDMEKRRADSLALQQAERNYRKKREALMEKKQRIKQQAADQEIEADTAKIRKKLEKLRKKHVKKTEKLTARLEGGNFLMRIVGEPPTLYNSVAAEITREQMQRYLQVNGFLDAKVAVDADTAGKRISVAYKVQEGPPYHLRYIHYTSQDSAVLQVVEQAVGESELEPGKRYYEEDLASERQRMVRLLQNNGYFEFDQTYVRYRVNDTLPDQQLDVFANIRKPAEGQHQKFYIDEVYFETDVDVNKRRDPTKTEFRGITYLEGENSYAKKVLDSKIFIRPDSLYRISDTEKTQINLANLDIFKFVNIKFDTVGNRLLTNIFTSPYPKYQYAIEGGLNVSQSLPGPFVSLSLKNRNVLGGAEILEMRFRAAIEAQAGATEQQNFRSQEYGANFSLTFPRILFPIRSKAKRKLGMFTPTTKVQAGYAYISRPEYTRTNFQAALNYQWRNEKGDVFSLNLLDLSLIDTERLADSFEERLEELRQLGSTLIFSFDRSLVSNINMSFIRSSNPGNFSERRTHYYRFYVESAGTSGNLFRNAWLKNDGTLFGLRYFRYFKALTDLRLGFPIGKEGQLATRLQVGLARPYGGTLDALPYEKYFFSGGSNSNRAWAARRVGPGSYTPETLEDGSFDYSFEQPGEFIIEANIELRRDLVSFFEGAFFIDASNVWTFGRDPFRPGARLEGDFWKELAIGAGLGLRVDFEFLLVRFDVGVKMYDPARPLGERFIGDNLSFAQPLGEPGQYTFNLGIGYPF